MTHSFQTRLNAIFLSRRSENSKYSKACKHFATVQSDSKILKAKKSHLIRIYSYLHNDVVCNQRYFFPLHSITEIKILSHGWSDRAESIITTLSSGHVSLVLYSSAASKYTRERSSKQHNSPIFPGISLREIIPDERERENERGLPRNLLSFFLVTDL